LQARCADSDRLGHSFICVHSPLSYAPIPKLIPLGESSCAESAPSSDCRFLQADAEASRSHDIDSHRSDLSATLPLISSGDGESHPSCESCSTFTVEQREGGILSKDTESKGDVPGGESICSLLCAAPNSVVDEIASVARSSSPKLEGEIRLELEPSHISDSIVLSERVPSKIAEAEIRSENRVGATATSAPLEQLAAEDDVKERSSPIEGCELSSPRRCESMAIGAPCEDCDETAGQWAQNRREKSIWERIRTRIYNLFFSPLSARTGFGGGRFWIERKTSEAESVGESVDPAVTREIREKEFDQLFTLSIQEPQKSSQIQKAHSVAEKEFNALFPLPRVQHPSADRIELKREPTASVGVLETHLSDRPAGREIAQEVTSIDRLLARQLVAEEVNLNPDQMKTAEGASEEKNPSDSKSQGYLINFPNVSVKEYVRFVSRLTNKNFIFDDKDLDFNVTIISEEPTSVENVISVLLQVLRVRGLSLTEEGNNILIHKEPSPLVPSEILLGDGNGAPPREIVTRLIKLSGLKAAEISEIIKPMLSTRALVQILNENNSLLITDLAANVAKIHNLIQSIDFEIDSLSFAQYVGVYNYVENLIPSAEKILSPLIGDAVVTMVPHKQTNSVFIVAPPNLINTILGVFERLDYVEGATQILDPEHLRGGKKAERPTGPDGKFIAPDGVDSSRISDFEREKLEAEKKQMVEEKKKQAEGEKEIVKEVEEEQYRTKFFIHKLQFRRGETIINALLNISDSLRLNEKANLELINAIQSIQWVEPTNSLVVTGTVEALEQVKELIFEIDQPLRQVFLEMLILETTIADSLTYFVDWGFSSDENITFQSSRVTANGAETTTVTSQGIGSGATRIASEFNSASNAGLAFSSGVIGKQIRRNGEQFPTIAALVKAVHASQFSDVLLNPKIVVEDNHEAEVFVGDTIPFQSQVITNDQGNVITNNVEYREIGTRLKVKPLIGNNNIVTLNIEEEVSRETPNLSTGGGSTSSTQSTTTPTTSKSTTTTQVHVPDGWFVVLSGMIRTEKTLDRSQIPCLGCLPFVFGGNRRSTTAETKRNQMIFIRPQIIDNEWEFEEITRRQQNRWQKLNNKKKYSWRYEIDEALEFLNLPPLEDKTLLCPDSCR
ncbi:MAG: hypothetical protein KDK40_01990, partial [Chlamydiia bacterium]|nr:hypothetical protein [Chlamydiia bacterium]